MSEDNRKPASDEAEQTTGETTEELGEENLEQISGGYQTGGSGKPFYKELPTDQLNYGKIQPNFDKI